MKKIWRMYKSYKAISEFVRKHRGLKNVTFKILTTRSILVISPDIDRNNNNWEQLRINY